MLVCWTSLPTSALHPDSIYKQAQFLKKIRSDSALFYYNQILDNKKLATTNPEIYAKSLREKALLLVNKNENQLSISLCQQAIQVFQKIKNAKEIGITYNSIANIYQVQGYYDLAIAHYQKAAVLFDSIQFLKGLTVCYSNIASIYNYTEQYNNALRYNLLAYQTAKLKNDTFSIATIAHDVSIAFTKTNKEDSAQHYAQLALQDGKAIQNNFVIAYAYEAFYEYYKSKQNWQAAQQNAQASLQYISKTTSKYDAAFAYCNLAESYLHTNKKEQAKIAIQKAEIQAKTLLSFQLNKRIYALYYAIESALGNYKSALHYVELYQQNSDSVFFEKRNNTLNELETKYQTAQKETKIAQQKIEIQQQQLKTKQATTRLLVVGILCLLALVGSLFLYLFFKQRQKLLQERILNIEQQKQLELTQAIMDGEEQERVRLANELHDGIGGLMSMLKLQFANVKKNNESISHNAEYNKALDLLNTTAQDIRKISHALMPSALERLGLIDALTQFCTQMQHNAHLDIDFQHYHFETRLAHRQELLIYRIIQELLNNIVKYANAKEVLVQLIKNEKSISITVEDDGIGFDVSILKNKTGIGLNSMQHRIQLLGGTMDINSNVGKGTSINIDLPIK